MVVWVRQGDTNAQSLTHVEDEVQQELFDMIVHVGDFACTWSAPWHMPRLSSVRPRPY